jgi:hypothetical protein
MALISFSERSILVTAELVLRASCSAAAPSTPMSFPERLMLVMAELVLRASASAAARDPPVCWSAGPDHGDLQVSKTLKPKPQTQNPIP